MQRAFLRTGAAVLALSYAACGGVHFPQSITALLPSGTTTASATVVPAPAAAPAQAAPPPAHAAPAHHAAPPPVVARRGRPGRGGYAAPPPVSASATAYVAPPPVDNTAYAAPPPPVAPSAFAAPPPPPVFAAPPPPPVYGAPPPAVAAEAPPPVVAADPAPPPVNGGMAFSSTTTTTTTTTVTSSNGSGADVAAAAGCNGDFTLGSLPLTCRSCSIGNACDNADAPRNCPDGTYLRWGDGRCVCVARCSSFGVSEGQSCGEGFTCRAVQATNRSGNRANICVSDGWSVCRQGQVPAPEPRRRYGS